MSVPKEVEELVHRFREQEESYLSHAFNEAQVRQQFLNPLFKALGWDMENSAGYAEAYKDVVHEDALQVSGGHKAPDYCFRIGGARKFFLEAKKPAVNLELDAGAAFQLRRYAWSAKLPLSVLSNFAQFAVYDCRLRPSLSDKPSKARTMFFTYDQLSSQWNEFAAIFGKQEVLRGSFDKYAVGARGKRGTSEVDNEFLKEIEGWRNSLAKNIAVRNPGIVSRDLNFAVQQTIDRIIFLRIAEDRGIEPYGKLQTLLRSDDAYEGLKGFYYDADDRYNSGLFHFAKEKGRSHPHDQLTPSLRIDDRVLKDIVKALYYPESPYAFGVIPLDILGQVYEQFLGKVIRLTAAGHAKVEEKPEVRKAGGVYYTPTYVVKYIVNQTIGRLLKEAPTEVARTSKNTRPLRVLDPACGSGSFLLIAYETLLDWYRDSFVAEGPGKFSKGKNPRLYQAAQNDWRLTTSERKRILLDHIFGVDLDPQAVEVTKLSLLLKVLESESAETIGRSLKLFHERALPDLDENIKCGNSLVLPDFNANQLDFGDRDERERVNPFDYGSEFPTVFSGRDPGFDVVIGNPPYAYRNATEDSLRPYYTDRYECAGGNFDLYKFFVERGLSLLNKRGSIGFILSATFLVQPSFEKLRDLILRSRLQLLAPLGPGVFKRATVDTAILVVEKPTPSEAHVVRVVAPSTPTDLNITEERRVPQTRFANNDGQVFDYRLTKEGGALVDRLLRSFPPIESGFEFGVGINTAYIKDELIADKQIDSRYHRMVPGDGISRYGVVKTKGWIMYDRDFVRSRGELGRTLPAEHLLSSEKILVVRTRNLSLPRRIVATIDRRGAYNLNRLSNIVARSGYSLEGLLGLMNSKLFNWLFSTRYFDYEIKPVYLRSAPLADGNDGKLIGLVRSMLDFNEKLESAKSPHSVTAIERAIRATDSQINKRVFELYGCSKAESHIVESESIE